METKSETSTKNDNDIGTAIEGRNLKLNTKKHTPTQTSEQRRKENNNGNITKCLVQVKSRTRLPLLLFQRVI